MTPGAGRWNQHAIILGTGGLFLLVALLPLLWPVPALLERPGEAFRGLTVFTSARPWTLLIRSFGLSAAVVGGALVIGIPLGLPLGRTNVGGGRLLLVAHAFPLFLPPFLLALGWFYLFGRQGLVGREISARLLLHPLGHVAILSPAFAPVVTTLVALSLWNVDPSLEEAARIVAPPLRVAARVLLPLVWAAIALSAILVFALAFPSWASRCSCGSTCIPRRCFPGSEGSTTIPERLFSCRYHSCRSR